MRLDAAAVGRTGTAACPPHIHSELCALLESTILPQLQSNFEDVQDLVQARSLDPNLLLLLTTNALRGA